MRILLVCAAGMSTSLLVTSMQRVAGEDDFIEARPYTELEEVIDSFDVVLVGPQMGYKLSSIDRLCREHGKAAEKIDMIAYGRINGDVVFEQAKRLYESLQK